MTRYSQLYVERGQREYDNERMRVRLGAFVRSYFSEISHVIAAKINTDIGVNLPPASSYAWQLDQFFQKAEIRDVLDAITIACPIVARQLGARGLAAWIEHVKRVFQEEHVCYRIGEDEIVHLFVDQEFETNQAATVAALDDARFGEARTNFDAAFRHLRDGMGRQAIRDVFVATETAAKVLFPGQFSRLMPNEIDKCVRPKMEVRYAGNQPAIDNANQLLTSFRHWINASQLYRHGQEVREPADPPQGLVIAHLSAGAAFLRWMIELATDSSS